MKCSNVANQNYNAACTDRSATYVRTYVHAAASGGCAMSEHVELVCTVVHKLSSHHCGISSLWGAPLISTCIALGRGCVQILPGNLEVNGVAVANRHENLSCETTCVRTYLCMYTAWYVPSFLGYTYIRTYVRMFSCMHSILEVYFLLICKLSGSALYFCLLTA